MNEIFYLMERWARWARTSNGAPKCMSPSFAAITQNMGGALPEAQISDEVACGADAALAELMQRSAESGEAVYVYFYFSIRSHAALGRKLGCCRPVARSRLDVGLAWLDGHLCELDEAA